MQHAVRLSAGMSSGAIAPIALVPLPDTAEVSSPLNASSRLHTACWEELAGSTGHPQMQTRSNWLRGDASYETVEKLWPSLIARREGGCRYASWSPALHSYLSLLLEATANKTMKTAKVKLKETQEFNVKNPSNTKGKNHGRQPARTSLYRVCVYNA
jgi:hypothetical protein